MPLWSELGEALASQISGYPTNDGRPVEAISAYQHSYGRTRLVQEVRRQIHHGVARPGDAHEAFCRLPFDIVCTTNVDCLLEDGYQSLSRDYHVIVEEDQLSVGVDRRTVTVVKMHGDVNHPHRLVLTEDDFDGYVARNPLLVTYLSNLLITRTALFVGYSLDDPDFRQILALIADRLGALRRQAYALTYSLGPHEVARYQRRNVRCIDLA